MKSRIIVNTSIVVTSLTIIAIFAVWFSSLLFKASLNTPIYYGVIITLTVASIIFGVLQILPGKRQNHPGAYKYDAHSEQQAHDDLASDMASALNEFPDKQQQAMSILLSDLIEQDLQQRRIERDFKAQQQNYPIKVTMEINGTPITIETPDAEKAGDIVNLITQRIQTDSFSVAEKKIQQSAVRESEETYKIEDNSE